jgi:hypothetical protein
VKRSVVKEKEEMRKSTEDFRAVCPLAFHHFDEIPETT